MWLLLATLLAILLAGLWPKPPAVFLNHFAWRQIIVENTEQGQAGVGAGWLTGAEPAGQQSTYLVSSQLLESSCLCGTLNHILSVLCEFLLMLSTTACL